MNELNSFILNCRDVEEEVWGQGGDRDLNKQNQGNLPLTEYQ